MVSTAPKKAEKTADTEATVRLTVAQATVRFLGNQYVEHDGDRMKFFAGCFGIFGHGNVAGLGQALLQDEVTALESGTEPALPYVLGRNEQAMVHSAVGLRPSEGPAADLGRDRQRRTRLDEHADRRRAGDHQPAAGAAAARRHVRHPGERPGAAGTRTARRPATSPSTTRSSRCRGTSTGSGGPSNCPPRCSARCGCSPTPSRPVRPPSPSRRTCRPRRTTGRNRCSPNARGTSPGPLPERVGDRPCGRGHPHRPQAADRRRRRRHLLRRQRRAGRVLRADRHSGGPDPGRQGLAALRPSAIRRGDRVHRHHGGQRAWPPRPTSSSESAPATAISPPRRGPPSTTPTCGSSTSTSRRSTRSSRAAVSVVADAREAIEALGAALGDYSVSDEYRTQDRRPGQGVGRHRLRRLPRR